MAEGGIWALHSVRPEPSNDRESPTNIWLEVWTIHGHLSRHVHLRIKVADTLFQNQAAWGANGKVWDTVAAVLTPVEAKKVQLLAKEPSVTSSVDRDLEDGRAAGINQTPTMFITRGANRYPLAGSVNYNLLRSLLDGLLAK